MATKTWSSVNGGNFNSGGKWNSGSPGIGDVGLIGLAGTYTVTVGTTTADLDGVILNNANTTLSVSQTFTLEVSFTAASAYTQQAGTLSLLGTLHASNASISGGVVNFGASGMLNVESGNNVLALSGGTINNATNGQVNVGATAGAAATTSVVTGGTLNVSGGVLNTGAFSATGGVFAQSSGSIDVVGTASFTGGTNLQSGGILNAGSISIGTDFTQSGGTLISDSTGISISATKTLTMSGGAVLDGTTGGITNSGTVTGSGVVNGAISGSGGTISSASSGSVTITGAISGSNTLGVGTGGTTTISTATSVGSSTINFAGATGTLAFGAVGALSLSNVAVTGMKVGVDAGTQTTVIDFAQDVISATFNNTTDILTVNLSTGTVTFQLNDLSGAHANFDTGTDTVFITDTVCYAAGTSIATPSGETAIEDLEVGDMVVVLDGDTRSVLPVKWVGTEVVNLAAHPNPELVAPVRIAADAFAPGVPARDLVVSPPHAIFVDGKLVPAKLLVNGMSITRAYDLRSVTYYHLELDRHAVILAEGLTAESYLDTGNRTFFANAGVTNLRRTDYHVDDASQVWAEQACAPLTTAPVEVRPIWTGLATRAKEIGFSEPAVTTTTDADLHLTVDGQRVEATEIVGRRHRFVLPRMAGDVRLTSRASAPSRLQGWRDDQRALGVAVRSITVRDGDTVDMIAADHPDLAQGWHGVERAGTAMWRWSNGNAALPISARDGAVIVDVQVADVGTYILNDAAETAAVAA
jgi:hypothetical protein